MEESLHFGNGKGTGLEYQILAGPAFSLVYTLAGIPVGWLADRYNRKLIFVVSLLFWSACTAAMGASQTFWQLLLARAGQGLGQAGCNPTANGIMAELFVPEASATARGVYSTAIYLGYSLAFSAAGPISSHFGFRAVYYVFGLVGLPIALAILFTVREPKRGVHDSKKSEAAAVAAEVGDVASKPSLLSVIRLFLRPSLLLLCLAGGVRNAAGYVWAFNTENFFENVHDQSKVEIAAYMGWIPLVGGSLGVVFGGFVADWVLKERGPVARIWVLVVSQLAAAPFCAGALLLPLPYAYLSLLPANIIGELWVGVTLAVVSSLLPTAMRGVGVAVYFFIIGNIAGLAPLAVPPLSTHFHSLRTALLFMYPGLYVLSSLLFFVTLTSLSRDLRKAAAVDAPESAPLIQARDDPNSPQ